MKFKNLRNELENYKNDLISLYNSKLGNSKHILQIEITEEGDMFNLVVVGPEEVKFIENGRGPGKFPPVDTMQEWVKEKLHETELPRVKSLAFLVGRKISIYGTEGNHLLEESINELMNTYKQRFENALLQDWNEDDSMEVLDKLNTMMKSAF